jgi:SAM-dependent methyltransferase
LSYWDLPTAARFIKDSGEWPEGTHVFDSLKAIIGKLNPRLLLDYGCGKGRMCEIIAPEKYIGYDINAQALVHARSDFPLYSFTNDWPNVDSDVTLLYTVISMVSDDQLDEMLSPITSGTVVIAEIIGRDWANYRSIPFIYNRDFVDIAAAMSRHGYALVSDIPLQHDHYSTWENHADNRIHILTFRRLTQ